MSIAFKCWLVLLVSCNFGVWIVSARSTPYNRELERFGKDRIGLKGLEIWPRLEDKKTDDAHRRRKETAYPLTNLWRTAPHVMRNMVTLAAADLSSLELNFASAGVGDVIEVSAGITLTSTISASETKSVTIKSGPGGRITLQGGGQTSNFGMFEFYDYFEATFMDLDITNGNTDGDGAAFEVSGYAQLTLIDVTLSGHSAGGDGGAIFLSTYNAAGLVLTSCSFTDITTAGSGGGALYASASLVSITNCKFIRCEADSPTSYGGAILFTGTTLVIKDSHFEACFSGTSGGAINHGLYGQSFGSTTIINSNFVENDSVLGGAVALLCDSTDMHVITDSTFSRNVAAFMPSTESGGMGADLYLNYGSAEVGGCIFSGSRAANMGGSLYSLSATLSISKCTFSHSDAKNGGAITLASGNNTIQSCSFSNINATKLGGAIFVPVTAPYYASKNEDDPTKLVVSDSSFEQCTSWAGGGMYVDVGVPLEVRTSNFTQCKADDAGGGIYASALAASAIKDTKFRACSAGFSGGAMAIVDGIVAVESCTFIDCSVSVVIETTTCLKVTMTDLFGDGWTGSRLYIMSLQDFVTIKRAGLDLTANLGLSGETDDDGFGTVTTNSTFTAHITTLVYGYTRTDTVCFDKDDGDDYVVVTTADAYAYEGAFTVTSSDGAIEYIANGAYGRVYALTPFEPFDTCAGSGGGAMHMSASAAVTVTKSSFTGCSTTNANGGTMAVVSDTPLAVDQTVVTVTDTIFDKSTSSHYGAIQFAALSKASLTNIEITAKHSDIESLSGVFFNSGGSITCTSICPAGSYGNCTAVDDCFSCHIDECSICPAGTYVATSGAVSKATCLACPSGTASVAGSDSCESCAVGTYGTNSASDTSGYGLNTGASFCVSCPPGRINPTKRASQCSACAAGTSSEANATECFKCGVGKYAELPATPACLNCEAGFYSPFEGMATCLECTGQFFSQEGSRECDACRRNYFYSGEKECVECPEGTSCLDDGASTQEKLMLEPDYFRISGNTATIHKCPYTGACIGGTNFSEIPGKSEFDPPTYGYCAEGFAGPLCAACAVPGFFFDAELNSCLLCDSGDDDGDSSMLSRLSSPIALILATFLGVIMIGSLFLICKPKAVPSSVDNTSKITKKDSSKIAKALIQAYKKLKKKQKSIAVKFKSLTSFSQISVNVGFNLNIKYPDNFTKLLEKLEVVNFDIFPSLAPACYIDGYSYINSMISMTMMPISIGAMLGLAYMVTAGMFAPRPKYSAKQLRKKYTVPDSLKGLFPIVDINAFRRTFVEFDADFSGSVDRTELVALFKKMGKNFDDDKIALMIDVVDVSKDGLIDFGEFIFLMNKIRNEKVLLVSAAADTEEGAGDSFAALAYEVEAKANLVRGQFLMYLFMLLSFTFLISASTAAFQYFKCHEFPEADGGTRRFLYKDYAVDCDSARYKTYVPYALLMILIYPIGIPLFYWLMLRQHKHVLSDEEAVKREASEDFPTIGHLTFLTQAYSSKYYYFEVLECVRRLILASVVGMLPADGVVAPTLGILLCFVFLYIFIDFRPYRNADDSNLGIILQYSITLFFLAGLLAKVNVTTDMTPSEAIIFGYALMFSLLLGPFMVLADFFKGLIVRRKVKVSLKEQLQKQKEVEAEYRKGHAVNALKDETERIQLNATKTDVVEKFRAGLHDNDGTNLIAPGIMQKDMTTEISTLARSSSTASQRNTATVKTPRRGSKKHFKGATEDL